MRRGGGDGVEVDGGEDEVGYGRVGRCEEGEDGDGRAGGGVVGLVVDYYAGRRGGGCWWHLSEGGCGRVVWRWEISSALEFGSQGYGILKPV